MASISVVLLGLNPETRLRTVVEYLLKRGVPKDQVPDVVLKHPRIFEYKVGRFSVVFVVVVPMVVLVGRLVAGGCSVS